MIADLNGEPITGRFYEKELQETRYLKEDVPRVEFGTHTQTTI